jgi:conserved oligomeric Golgi complex subunit 8
VLEQSLFFGGSLGRVGVDFRAVLVVYFEDHVVDLMTSSWEAACQDFESSLGAHALSGGSGSAAAGSKTPIVLASYRHALANSSTTQATPFAAHNGDHDFSPPRVLMSFPILAELTNALLSSFNELRLCTIVSVETRLAKRLHLTLAAVVGIISAFVQENRLALAPPTTTNDSASENGTRPTKAAALADAIRDMNEVRNWSLSFESLQVY